MARETLRIIRQNLAWAVAYNVLAIPLAVAGWVTPWMAGIGMSASSLLVVLNALRLQEAKTENGESSLSLIPLVRRAGVPHRRRVLVVAGSGQFEDLEAPATAY